jgi:hypothetical protein
MFGAVGGTCTKFKETKNNTGVFIRETAVKQALEKKGCLHGVFRQNRIKGWYWFELFIQKNNIL